MRNFLSAIFIILFSYSLSAQQIAVRDNSITRFINDWKREISKDPFYCADVYRFYNENVKWYNSSLTRDSLCILLNKNIALMQSLAASEYTTNRIFSPPAMQYRVVFKEQYSAITAMKEHYMLIEETSTGAFSIIAHSSKADDAWIKRKTEIARDTINFKKKKYYVLYKDTSAFAFGNTPVYFLTDSLNFFEPQYIDACNALLTFGYSAMGRIFVAIGNPGTREIFRMKEITSELTQPRYENAKLIRGGFPCLVPGATIVPGDKRIETAWITPALHWQRIDSRYSELTLGAHYIYGDVCWFSQTTIMLDQKKKRIEVKRKMKKPIGKQK